MWAAQFAWREALSTAFGKVQWATFGFSCTARWLHWRGFVFWVWGKYGGSFLQSSKSPGCRTFRHQQWENSGVFLNSDLRICYAFYPKCPCLALWQSQEQFVSLCMAGWSWVRESAPLESPRLDFCLAHCYLNNSDFKFSIF